MGLEVQGRIQHSRYTKSERSILSSWTSNEVSSIKICNTAKWWPLKQKVLINDIPIENATFWRDTNYLNMIISHLLIREKARLRRRKCWTIRWASRYRITGRAFILAPFWYIWCLTKMAPLALLLFLGLKMLKLTKNEATILYSF